MGSGDIRSCAGENIVALCDVDQRAVARNAQHFPKAKQYSDFRKMLETQEEIDAVIDYIKSTWPERERQYQADRTRGDEAARE